MTKILMGNYSLLIFYLKLRKWINVMFEAVNDNSKQLKFINFQFELYKS